jgi:deoxyribose-phosphate aldolase
MEGPDIAKLIDHTLLRPDATANQVDKLCDKAVEHGFFSVCVNPIWVGRCARRLSESDVKVCAVVGFPLGASESAIKAREAALAVENGADEVDMVMNIGRLLEGELAKAEEDIRGVVAAVGGRVVKVIIEICYLDEKHIIRACELAKAAGAHFVKTSTGFGPSGATVEAVRLMRQTVGEAMGVKAAGGIRDYGAAMKMVDAGASRLGTSASVEIVKGARKG